MWQSYGTHSFVYMKITICFYSSFHAVKIYHRSINVEVDLFIHFPQNISQFFLILEWRRKPAFLCKNIFYKPIRSFGFACSFQSDLIRLNTFSPNKKYTQTQTNTQSSFFPLDPFWPAWPTANLFFLQMLIHFTCRLAHAA